MSGGRDALFLGDSELAGLMREKRWEDTPLGPVERWPNSLCAAVRILLTSRFSMWLGWGDELTFFYNDAYRRDTLGSKPRARSVRRQARCGARSGRTSGPASRAC